MLNYPANIKNKYLQFMIDSIIMINMLCRYLILLSKLLFMVYDK